jgi:hypothetical protein
MKAGDLVIEKRLCAQPFHRQLSMVVEVHQDRLMRRVTVQSLTTGGIYWLYTGKIQKAKCMLSSSCSTTQRFFALMEIWN